MLNSSQMEIISHIHGSLLFNGHRRLSLLPRESSSLPYPFAPLSTNPRQESAGKTLEEMDFLFTPDRTPWVFQDRSATKIGAIFERDMAHGEALTAFDAGKAAKLDDLELGEHVEISQS